MAVLYFISFSLLKLQMPGFQNDIRVSFLTYLGLTQLKYNLLFLLTVNF